MKQLCLAQLFHFLRTHTTSIGLMPTASPVTPWLAHERHFDFRRTRVRFHTAFDLFSSAALDVGTSRLIRTLNKSSLLSQELGRPLRALDLGCGTGVLGLALAKSMPCGTIEVSLSDRDRLATAVARHNLMASDLDPDGPQAKVLDAGFGYGPVHAAGDEPYDLIVSNVPAKVGVEGLAEILFGAGARLRPGGVVAFVHVSPLTDTIDALNADFSEAHGPIETVDESVGKEHRSLHWRFPNGLPILAPGDPLHSWLRESQVGSVAVKGGNPLTVTAVHDVDEFDSLHYRTPLLVQSAGQRLPTLPGEERICVLNPNHGFLPAMLGDQREPAVVHVTGRDTLSIAIAQQNVRETFSAWGMKGIEVGKCQPHRTLPWLPATGGDAEGYHRIIGHLRWKEGRAAHETTLKTLAAALLPGGAMMISVGVGQAEGLKKLARRIGLVTSRTDTRRRGHAALVISPP